MKNSEESVSQFKNIATAAGNDYRGDNYKILICSSEYYPYGSGIANVAYNVAEQFKKLGINVTICSPTGPDIKLGSSKMIDKFGIFGLIFYWYRVSQYFKQNDYDGVWLHNPYFFKKNPFEDCVVTVHTTYHGAAAWKTDSSYSYFLRVFIRVATLLEKYSVKNLNGDLTFTGVGLPICDEMKQMGLGSNINYIPNGVDIDVFHPSDKKMLRNKFAIPQDDLVLLSVGRLSLQKQLHKLVEVFSELEKEMPNVTLCIAGKGPLLESLKNLAESLKLKKIKFLGYVDNNDLPSLYACSDYYVMTSKYEGLPLTLLEAMASGLPCIVSDIPHLKMVEDADCGIIIDFEDIDLASHRIYQYLQNEHPDHTENARTYALKNLDWRIVSEQYLTLLQDLNQTRFQKSIPSPLDEIAPSNTH